MYVDSDYSIFIYGEKLSFEKKRNPVLIKLNKEFELLSDIMLENYTKPKIIELYDQIYHQFKNLETRKIYYLDKQRLNLTEKKSFNEDFLKIIDIKKIDRLKAKDILFNTKENKILY